MGRRCGWEAISVTGIALGASFIDVARSQILETLMAQGQHPSRGVELAKTGIRGTGVVTSAMISC